MTRKKKKKPASKHKRKKEWCFLDNMSLYIDHIKESRYTQKLLEVTSEVSKLQDTRSILKKIICFIINYQSMTRKEN